MIILINSYYSLLLSMRAEFYIQGNKLITKQAWEKIILDIKRSISKMGEDLNDRSKARGILKQGIIRAVEQRLPDKKFGVMFSGGVDSSLIALIAKKAGKDFVCYTMGFQEGVSKEPEDVIYARKTADELGLNLKIRVISLGEAHKLFKKTVKILGKELSNVINIGVGGVVLACIEMAKKDNVKYLFSGLGSEEVFAGYQRHREAEDKQAECWRGLLTMYERDLLRDYAIAKSEKIMFLTPFLNKDMIVIAMRIPAKFKINDKISKIILREVAQELGLPKNIAWRKKRAAQYGSRLDKAIAKLAKKNNFELKKDYLRSLE